MCARLSQLHAELSEQAAELGFESLDAALKAGYEVDWEEQELVNPYVLDRSAADEAYEEAHRAWLKEKEAVLADLRGLGETDKLAHAIDFVEKCHD